MYWGHGYGMAWGWVAAFLALLALAALILLVVRSFTADPRGPVPPRARLMACTSEALFQRALEGSFNERLLYRLNTIHLVVPPDADDW